MGLGGNRIVVRTFQPTGRGLRRGPDDEAARILSREDSIPAAIAFAQERVDSHPHGSASKGHWIQVASVLRRWGEGKRDGDHRVSAGTASLPKRDPRPAWPCASQDRERVSAMLATIEPGREVAVRRVAEGRLSYSVVEVTSVSRGLGRVVLGTRAFHVRSCRPVEGKPGVDETVVALTGAVRAYAADYPRGRELGLLKPRLAPV